MFMAMDQEAQRLQLKKLIIRGKDQGYLTYREINDHLPEEVYDTDQIETVVNMINDMGIDVYDQTPDPETLLMKNEASNPDSDDDAEEAEGFNPPPYFDRWRRASCSRGRRWSRPSRDTG